MRRLITRNRRSHITRNLSSLLLGVLFCLTVIPLFSGLPVARALGSIEVTIETSDGGYTSPYAGTYFYWEQSAFLEVYAHPWDGYYWVGWNYNGTFTTSTNPIEIDLDNADNETLTLSAVFSTVPYYNLTLNSADDVYLSINGIGKLCSSSNSTYQYQGGSTLHISYALGGHYEFVQYWINGSLGVYVPDYDFVFNGPTYIEVVEYYNPPETVPTGTVIEQLSIIIIPASIILLVSMAFRGVGEKFGGHGNAGTLIGGTISVIMCGQTGLIPIWFIVILFVGGGVGLYLWFRR